MFDIVNDDQASNNGQFGINFSNSIYNTIKSNSQQ